MSESLVMTEDILGEDGFTLKWSILPHWVDVTAFERVGTEISSEPYLSGFVKWDGCTELDQGSTHWCGLEGYKKHCELLQYIYIRSQQLMTKADRKMFGGPWIP